MNITAAYFQKGDDLEVPNQTATRGGQSDTTTSVELARYITLYETKFLKRLLGSLYADYIANPADARWVALNGKLFDSTNFVSPVANYIFFHFYRDHCLVNTGIGAVEAKASDSLQTSQRLCQAWNGMVEMMEDVDSAAYLLHTSADYTLADYDWTDFTRTINPLV